MQKHKNILISPEIKEKIKKEYTGHNQRKLAEKYNVEFSSVCHFLAENDVKGMRKHRQTY